MAIARLDPVTRMYTCAYIHRICWAFIHTLSRSPFEYNSLYWHCWRELSKQLSRPLLWLRSVRWAVGWRGAAKRVSVSVLRPVSILERSMAERHGSDHQKAQLRKSCLTWNCHHQMYLPYWWMSASLSSAAALSNIMFFVVSRYSD